MSVNSNLLIPQDDLSHSSTQSTSLDALDALVESSSSSISFNGPLPILSNQENDKIISNQSNYKTSLSNVPPPKIPDIFKSAIPFMGTSQPSSHLQPLQIPEVFRNSTATTAVPSEVFTNPNFWLKTDNWVSSKKQKRSNEQIEQER